jgi:tyrosyl-tRNA synthetase
MDEFVFDARKFEKVWLPALLSEAFSISRNQARQIIKQRGLRIDGEVWEFMDCGVIDIDGRVVQIGKKRFIRPRYA